MVQYNSILSLGGYTQFLGSVLPLYTAMCVGKWVRITQTVEVALTILEHCHILPCGDFLQNPNMQHSYCIAVRLANLCFFDNILVNVTPLRFQH